MDDQVETTAPELVPASPEQPPPSTTVPATPPTPSPEELVKSAVKTAEERTRREAQASKDREIAQRLKEQERHYRERERALRETYKGRLKQAGDDKADEFDQVVDMTGELAEFRAWKQQQAAMAESQSIAAGILEAFGAAEFEVKWDDQRLLNCSDWNEYRTRVKNIVADESRKTREREAAERAQKERDAATARVDSGDLSTLAAPAAGGPVGDPLEKLTVKDTDVLYKMASQNAAREIAERKKRAKGK